MENLYQNTPKKVIIDTDAGVDDAHALFLAIAAHKNPKIPFEIIAITTVAGNAAEDDVFQNVCIVLDSAGVKGNSIPIYRGAKQALVQPWARTESTVHGADGFGGMQNSPDLPVKRQERLAETEFAVTALTRLTREQPGDLTIITLGPLTNLAIAINVDPDFTKNVKELLVMGGNIHGVGNIRPCAEFNFFADPESAFVVLGAGWRQNILMVPWESCKLAMLPLEWRKSVFGCIESKQVKLLNMIEQYMIKRNEERFGKWMSADAVCMVVLLNPNIVLTKMTHYCTVELQGAHTRSQMVVDYPAKTGMQHNVTIVEQIDTQVFQNIMMVAFQESNFV